jgi:hypothetical protein
MDQLRTSLFVVALALLALAVIIEVAGPSVLPAPEVSRTVLERKVGEFAAEGMDVDTSPAAIDELMRAARDRPPGMAIRWLGLLDAQLLFIVLLVGAALVVPERVHGRVQGVATLIFSFLVTLGGIALVLLALLALLLMIALFTAVPFGTIAYFAMFGFFNRPGSTAMLSAIMLLKLGFAVCLVLAHPRFLQNRGLVLLILTSLLATVIVSFLHGIVPIFLVSITDALAAVIVGIIAVIWALVILIGSIPSVIKVLRVDRALS